MNYCFSKHPEAHTTLADRKSRYSVTDQGWKDSEEAMKSCQRSRLESRHFL